MLASLLTLCHFALLAALNSLAVVVPADGRVRQAGHLALKHRLSAFNHLHVSQGFDKVRHGPLLDFALQHLIFFWDGRHLLQLGPGGREG